MSDKRDEVKRKDELAETVAEIRFDDYQKYGRIANNLDVFDDIVEKAENGYFLAEPPFENHIASALEDADVIERFWSQTPRYHVEDIEAIREFEDAFREFDSRGWSKRDINATLKAVSEHILEEEKISSKALRKGIRGAPNPSSVCRNYGSWNNAVLFAGLYPKRQDMGEEEIRDRFRKKFYEVDGFPGLKDLDKDPSMPTREQIIEKFGSYNELVESEFPYRLDRDERGHNHDILEFERDLIRDSDKELFQCYLPVGEQLRDEIKRKDELTKKVADIRFSSPQKYDAISNNLDVFEDVIEKAEDGYFTSDSSDDGYITRVLADAGIIDVRDENGPTYYAEDAEAIREFEDAFREFDSRGWSKRDINATLKAISEHVLEEEKISSKALRDIDGAPSSGTVSRKCGSWRNAVFFAGLSPKRKDMDREEIEDRFRKKFYEADGFPGAREFDNDPSMPARCQIEKEFASYNELVESEFPYRLDRNEKGHNYDILETDNFDYSKWEAEQDIDSAVSKVKT